MNKLNAVIKSKVFIFFFQFLVLSTFIYSCNHHFNFIFDESISKERKDIIQFIANFIMFETTSSAIFIYFIWFNSTLIPIFIYNDYKKAYSMNLTTFFLPNFFFFVFLFKYSPNYFNSYFQVLFTQTVLLGLFIVAISIGISIVLKKMKRRNVETLKKSIMLFASNNKSKCLNCGVEFDSIPKYCYNCSKELIKRENDIR